MIVVPTPEIIPAFSILTVPSPRVKVELFSISFEFANTLFTVTAELFVNLAVESTPKLF